MSENNRTSRHLLLALIIVAAFLFGGIAAAGLNHWAGRSVFGADKIPLKIADGTVPLSLGDFKNGFLREELV